MSQKTKQLFIGLGVLFAIVFLWFIATRAGGVDPLFLPSPEKAFQSFITLSQGGLWMHVGVTSLRVLVAVLLSFVFAIPISILLYWNKVMRSILSPIADFMRYLPVPALVPLLILFFGIGETAKISVLFIGTFFQALVLIFDFIKNIHREYYELAYVLHFNKRQVYLMQIRAMLPELWDTLRISIGLCWTYVIIAELIATDIGIGRVIKEAQRFSDSSKLYVAIIVIGVVGLCVDQAMKHLGRRLFRYRYIRKEAN